MTATQRVERARRILRLVAVASALLWAGAVLFALLATTAALGALVALSSSLQTALLALSVTAMLATLLVVGWRTRFVWSFQRVALWIEEHVPELRYALVTAVDPSYRDQIGTPFERAISRLEAKPYIGAAAARFMVPPAVAMLLTGLAFVSLPTGWQQRALTSGAFHPVTPGAIIIGNRLSPLSGSVAAPAYAHQAAQSLDEPSTISGLRGSRVMLTGAGSPDGIQAILGERSIPIVPDGRGWSLSFTLSDTLPSALKLVDRQYNRLIVVDPRVDRAPGARLVLPARDTTLRFVTGSLVLSARFTDDIGLSVARFEYIVAQTGEDDKSTARAGVLGTRTLGGTSGAFDLTIPFASLKLVEGDLISVRAVVTDNNTLYGPGYGYSETRTIRIARKEEYDSLAVNKAPASADTAMITLRMLIISTENLDKARPAIERSAFVDSSRKLAGRAEIVRRKVQAIIAQQTGGGEIAANPLLTEASDAMWNATLSLQIAATPEAIPQLWVAYKALEKLRNEKRYYLRGRVLPVVVNIERVRLTGGDTGKAIPRGSVRPDAEIGRSQLRERYSEAVRELRSDPNRAIELLTLLRVATLRSYPDVAQGLGDAVTAIRKGTDATIPLLRARRVLDNSAGPIDTIPRWSGAW
jgi:hypothetical protein